MPEIYNIVSHGLRFLQDCCHANGTCVRYMVSDSWEVFFNFQLLGCHSSLGSPDAHRASRPNTYNIVSHGLRFLLGSCHAAGAMTPRLLWPVGAAAE